MSLSRSVPTDPGGRTLVMGVLNVTPDSFSDGGRHVVPDEAVRHGHRLLAEGADLVDVGGESTRPGAHRVDADEELRRVVPVVRELAAAGAVVSVDTMRAQVAATALEAGAAMINDVSGGRADPDMTRVVAEASVPFVVMHWRAHAAEMADHAHYDDLVADVVSELRSAVDAAVDRGVDPARVVVDPGLGFAKTKAQSWTLLRHLDAIAALGHPVLVAASRKGFLGELLADPVTGRARPVGEREDATVAVTTLAADRGAWGVRVHDVRRSADAVRVAARWSRG